MPRTPTRPADQLDHHNYKNQQHTMAPTTPTTLTHILQQHINQLPPTQAAIIQTHINTHGTTTGHQQGKDAGIRTTARQLGIAHTTVRRNLPKALAALRKSLEQAPEWQKAILQQHLTHGTINCAESQTPDNLLPTPPKWAENPE